MRSIQDNVNSKSNLKTSFRINSQLSKAILTGLIIMGSAMTSAHSELVIQEKNPEASITNQYAALKNADESSPQLHQLITHLNQRVSVNPKDALAWEILAQIYYDNGYDDYAVYAANEAVNLGYSTATLKNILLNSGAHISQSQLQSDYLTEDMGKAFVKEYQSALSKIYGEVYGFNYDESLPKPPAPVVKPRALKTNSKSKPRRTPVKKQTAPVKRRPAAKAKPAPKAQPVKKQSKPSTPRNNTPKSTDPFSILRSN